MKFPASVCLFVCLLGFVVVAVCFVLFVIFCEDLCSMQIPHCFDSCETNVAHPFRGL